MTRALGRLVREIRRCRLCVEAPLGKPLPHEPRPVLRVSTTARLAIVGQAPGTRVHASGIPYSDPSGRRLRDWMGVSEDEFYDEARIAIIPMGFCFPGLDAAGGDLPPRRECAPHWRPRLFALLPQVELVLLVGLYAQRWHLGSDARRSMHETVRDFRSLMERPGLPRVIPLPHPSWRNNSWLNKNPWFEAVLLPELRRKVGGLIRDQSKNKPFTPVDHSSRTN
ncbi:uracil-DNA glycosylase family protein [Hyphomicrobium sp.]|uniref:uracil-DNA glycosylase family protein n=1 Tax=Hyphomicrobium sp. TaxID=82 RepID=UPI002E363015|nr:uracil-DNA glycosylase family protein [Hyphomicrobium sp.]HEX2842905.1 uracil-DNA glycosylase family protein [Hyphomicrobium sp.]